MQAITEGTEIIEPLIDRLIGRTAFETVKHPETGAVMIEKNEVINEDTARLIDEAGIDEVLFVQSLHVTRNMVRVRSVTDVTLRRVKRLKLGKLLVLSPLNQLVSLVHS